MGNKVSTKIIHTGFPALRHRNFRLFWFGQCISLIGTWMQNIGQSWLVLELTHSALKLSIVTMMQFIPMMIFSLYAGTLADRHSRQKLIIFTQSALAVLAVVLATLTYFKIVEYWHILILALLLGLVNTLDVPTRQAFVIDLVGKEDLTNAIALNSSIFNLGRVAGPAVAGLLIGAFGIAVCFYLNAVSFIAVIVNLCMIRLPITEKKEKEPASLMRITRDIHEGLSYINQKQIIKQPLLLLAFISMFVMNFNILIPVFAQQQLNQNATGYGLLMTGMGLGSFVGALTLVAKSKNNPRLRYLVGGAAGMSVLLSVLSLERNFAIAFGTLFFIGFCSILFTTIVNTTIQLNSSDEMRGRVMSVYTLVFGGVIPIGSLYTGHITEAFGAPGCMVISGIIGVIATVWSISSIRNIQARNSGGGER